MDMVEWCVKNIGEGRKSVVAGGRWGWGRTGQGMAFYSWKRRAVWNRDMNGVGEKKGRREGGGGRKMI